VLIEAVNAYRPPQERGPDVANIDVDLGLDSFREEVRTWLAENVIREKRPGQGRPMREWDAEWQRRQYEGGWAGIDWPREYGGRGLRLLEQIVWYEEYVQSGIPIGENCFVVALAHAGPTLIARATEEQKKTYLPPILRGETPWCQGFSEPGTGSDLASLQTRAVIEGDELVVTGQKVWTSYGNVADYQEMLVRTDPDAPKHKGITWVICDMHAPGIEVRPIRTIDGEAHFTEIFYDSVRIPLSNVVDEINNGWSVAMSTLAIERGPVALDYQLQTVQVVEDLVELAKERGMLGDEELARRLAGIRAEASALRAMTYVGVSQATPGQAPPPISTAVRTFWAQLRQDLARLMLDMLGPAGLEASVWTTYWLTAFSATIAGGTKDIQKNIIGERVLGLPR
jgi:alkylation response protein AidB-like acyl-CoA dehydrogenase